MSNDWIKWTGGDCPVELNYGTKIDVILRDGTAGTESAGDLVWSHDRGEGDIVSYRISDIQSPPIITIQSQQMVKTNPNDSGKPCLCFPGQCRGQVIDGKQPNGDRCKIEFAESDEAWFEWDVTTLPTHPGLGTAGNMKIEWELATYAPGVTRTGEARDPHWAMSADSPYRVTRYRWIDPRVMLLHPVTGKRRDAVDIMQDPEGHLVWTKQDKGLMAFKHDAAVSAQVTETGQRILRESIATLAEAGVEIETDPAKIEAVFEADQESDDMRLARMRLASPTDAQWAELGEAMRSMDKPPQVDEIKSIPEGESLTADLVLHILRNPYGWAEDTKRRVYLFAADVMADESNAPEVWMKLRNEPVSVFGADNRDMAFAAYNTLERLGYTYIMGDWRTLEKVPAMTAPDLLDAAAGHMRDRAKTYDKPEGERSMGATVQAFNAITGLGLAESDGWLLMCLLKMVRSSTRDEPHRDSVEDLVAYAGLYGEARLGGV